MSGSPGSGGSNPRKFSEKIALHNQKQAEETRAFEQLMTDLTVSRVQFQKIQQLRLNQTRAQYYGGSLPNVNQIGNTSTEFQSSPYGTVYLSPPPDNSWRRTNSDSALHTSAMSPNQQEAFGMNQQMGRGPPQRNVPHHLRIRRHGNEA
ncbi:hypothetical protein JZ751_020717 [Albula glossodonta]|uniref:Transducer of regulated CREB activity N-terminal domain-containing protein n=1 Tax=Albula glossodonta TaxID=121402 RepID=A0A8T2PIG9_9TELE|nr:hypothetical protein JZ751_020717 [Albula glossodonta]